MTLDAADLEAIRALLRDELARAEPRAPVPSRERVRRGKPDANRTERVAAKLRRKGALR